MSENEHKEHFFFKGLTLKEVPNLKGGAYALLAQSKSLSLVFFPLPCPVEVELDSYIWCTGGREPSSLKELGWLGGFKGLRTSRLLGHWRVGLGGLGS